MRQQLLRERGTLLLQLMYHVLLQDEGLDSCPKGLGFKHAELGMRGYNRMEELTWVVAYQLEEEGGEDGTVGEEGEQNREEDEQGRAEVEAGAEDREKDVLRYKVDQLQTEQQEGQREEQQRPWGEPLAWGRPVGHVPPGEVVLTMLQQLLLVVKSAEGDGAMAYHEWELEKGELYSGAGEWGWV